MTATIRKVFAVATVSLALSGAVLCAQVYSPGHGVTPPRVVRSAPMPRPASLVIIECVIEADGTLSASKVVRSGTADDDKTVLDAVSHWQFEAGTKDDTPVAVRFYLSFPRGR